MVVRGERRERLRELPEVWKRIVGRNQVIPGYAIRIETQIRVRQVRKVVPLRLVHVIDVEAEAGTNLPLNPNRCLPAIRHLRVRRDQLRRDRGTETSRRIVGRLARTRLDL